MDIFSIPNFLNFTDNLRFLKKLFNSATSIVSIFSDFYFQVLSVIIENYEFLKTSFQPFFND